MVNGFGKVKRWHINSLWMAIVFLGWTASVASGCHAASPKPATGVPAKTISVWTHEETGSREFDVLRKAAKRFNRQQRRYRVEIVSSLRRDYDSWVQREAATGTLPCLLEFDGPMLAAFAWPQFLQSIDRFVTPELLQDFLPSIVAQGTYQGQLYSLGQFDSGVGLWGNRRYLHAAGVRIPTLQSPWSLAEFEDALAKLAALKEVDYAINFSLYATDPEFYSYAYAPILQSFGGDVQSELTRLPTALIRLSLSNVTIRIRNEPHEAQMSHELRTPLNAILGYAEILQRNSPLLTKHQARGLMTIQESGQHLLNLINDILDLARIEAGKLALYPVEIDLSMLLRVVTDIVRIKADQKNLLFSHWASLDLPVAVKADDKRLRQVLLNLLGNAIKFTDRGEVSLRVQRAASPSPDKDGEAMVRLRFEVQDSGIGMNDEQLSRIFQPFEQVAEVQRREGGTELGLSISQQLVHLMGGHIQVNSQPGKGSLFWFELDLPVVAAGTAVLPAPQIIVGYQGPRRKVLIVDEVPQNLIMLMDALSPLGFVVFDAENGQECLDLLDSVNPDLIVMDVAMPVMNGREATRQIRNLPKFARIPIIAASASASGEDEARNYAAGANAFLSKPIEHHLLLKVVGELLFLKWINKESPQEAGEAHEDASNFVTPPQDEIEELYQLARLGNMQNIQTRADYLQNLDSRSPPSPGNCAIWRKTINPNPSLP